jgi:hypothetical protein
MARNPVATAENGTSGPRPTCNDRAPTGSEYVLSPPPLSRHAVAKTAHDGPIAAAHIVPLSHARHRLLAPRRDAAVSFPKLT